MAIRLESENTSSTGKTPEETPAAGTAETVQCEEEDFVERPLETRVKMI
jgi:hypothetical protein